MVTRLLGAVSLAVLTSLGACEKTRGLARPVRTDCGDSQPRRFFDDVFYGLRPSESEIPNAFAPILDQMGEPSLSCSVDFDAAYRILFSAPNGMAMAIRMVSSDGQWTLISVPFDKKLQKTVTRSERPVTPSELRQFLGMVAKFDFWVRSPNPTPTSTDTDVVVLHSGVWIFEGSADGQYHAIVRASLPREREFNAIGKWLFTAANYEVPGEFLVPAY